MMKPTAPHLLQRIIISPDNVGNGLNDEELHGLLRQEDLPSETVSPLCPYLRGA